MASKTKLITANSDDYFGTGYSGFPGTHDADTVFAPKYEREMPENFKNKHLDDMFMHSMIDVYAKEGRNPDGSPNGKFVLDKEAAKKASEEVLKTHMHLTGKKLENYMTMNFDETWNYYDVNNEDAIEADRMHTFF